MLDCFKGPQYLMHITRNEDSMGRLVVQGALWALPNMTHRSRYVHQGECSQGLHPLHWQIAGVAVTIRAMSTCQECTTDEEA